MSPASVPLDRRRADDARPLIVTDDAPLLDDLLRLAAVAGVEPFVVADAFAARARWVAAPLVVVGQDAVADVARARFARHDAMLVVTAGQATAEQSREVWAHALAAGARDVLALPAGEHRIVDAFTACDDGGEESGSLIAVLGGRGGAGATTLVAALALSAVRRGSTALAVEVDPLGAGLDVLFGGESTPGMRWSQLAGARGRIAPATLSGALPIVDGVALLACDAGLCDGIPPDAVASVVDGARRAFEVVVADLPRHLDAASQEVLQRASLTLLVVPADLRATSAAARVAGVAAPHTADLRVVVRGPAMGGLTAETVAAALGLPLAGDLRPEPGCAARLERGDPPGRGRRGPLGAFCESLLDEVELRSPRRVA